MELELKKVCLDNYEASGDVMLTQEETTEVIVPDYCPDIARIISADGKVYLHSRELRDGKAAVTGTVRVTVLYTPDGEGGIRTLEFAMPFSCESDHRSLAECVFLDADTRTEFLEARMLNPRKVFAHCKLVSRLTGYRKSPICICSDLTAEERFCLEKRQEKQRVTLLTHIAEKDFTFTETMNLSPGREGAAELLNSQICSNMTESKIVGSKLILKGVFSVSVLYRSVDGKYAVTSSELPFSQIMEVEGAAEGCVPTLKMHLTGADLQIDGEDAEGRQIAVTLYLHATALLREEQEFTLLSDLYSTSYETSYEAEPLHMTALYETFTRRHTVREILEIGVVAESILSLTASCGAVSVSREGETTVLRTEVTVRALYQDEGGVPLVAERSFDIASQLELPEDCSVTARAVCTEEVQGSLGDRGIEVRFPVDFRAEAVSQLKKICITTAKLDLEAAKDAAGAPSLVLRCLGKQESSWELAKKYNTTIAMIQAANQLEDGEIPHDKLLLIPRKRA